MALEPDERIVRDYLRQHFAFSDEPLHPPIDVPNVRPERVEAVLGDLYRDGYIEGIKASDQRCPIIISGLTERGL